MADLADVGRGGEQAWLAWQAKPPLLLEPCNSAEWRVPPGPLLHLNPPAWHRHKHGKAPEAHFDGPASALCCSLFRILAPLFPVSSTLPCLLTSHFPPPSPHTPNLTWSRLPCPRKPPPPPRLERSQRAKRLPACTNHAPFLLFCLLLASPFSPIVVLPATTQPRQRPPGTSSHPIQSNPIVQSNP